MRIGNSVHRGRTLLIAAAAAAMAGTAPAQEAGEGERLLAQCAAAARSGDRAAMEPAARAAERLAGAMRADAPADALVLRARVLVQCRIPFAGMMRQGALLEESNRLLAQALQAEPRHLGARLALGMNHFHAPAFLGRAGDARRELERLVAEHGGEGDGRSGARDAAVATAYLYLGLLHERGGRRGEALGVWREGSRRFPGHGALAERAGEVGGDAADGGGAPAPGGEGTGVSAPPHPGRGGDDRPYVLAPIVIEAGGYSLDDPRSATRVTRMEVYQMPGGAADVLQVFQSMPGVTRVNDGSDLYVRGGDPAEAPVYVDGARLFHAGRFEGLNGSVFGVLDPSVMKRAYFSSGGFSVRYGNALSGLVDVETDGRPAARRWRAGANLATLGATLWQPTGARSGVWATTSLTHTGALLALHGRSAGYPTAPRSAQGMAGAAFEPTERTTLRLTALGEWDLTTALATSHGFDGEFRGEAGMGMLTSSLRHVSRDGDGSVRVALSASRRRSGFTFGVLDREREDRGLTGRLDGEITRGPVQWRGGVEGARLGLTQSGTVPSSPALAPGSPVEALPAEHEGAHHAGGYLEAEARATRRLALVGGLRVDRLPGEEEWSADPRLGAAYQVERWTFRVGGGRFSQGRWRTRYDLPDEGRPQGVPRAATHLAGGIQHEGAVSFRAEGFRKEYDSFVAAGGEAAVEGGVARGLDLLFRWPGTDRLSGWITYSLLDTELSLSDGRRIPSAHDVTHNATAVTRLSLGESLELGLTGRFATGRPITPVLGLAGDDSGRPGTPVYGELHSERLPSYARLDARLTRLVARPGGVVVLYLEGLNVLDRANVMGYTHDAGSGDRRPVRSFFAQRTLVLGVEAQF
jgi:vitamin B12 transporter